jgi:hypothetical protein
VYNYHDSRAHGYKQSGIIIGLVGFWEGFWLVMSGWSIAVGNCDWVGVTYG